MKIAILGFGREGKAILKLLKKKLPGQKIDILDKNLDKNYLENLSQYDIVYRTPGIPFNRPEIQSAIKNGVVFSSATNIFFNSVRPSARQARLPARQEKGFIIGITGTKGKGTTATLLYRILKTAGKKTFLVGNIGTPAIDVLPRLSTKTISVMELSSFQLQDLEKSPDIAVVTHIFPDHLDHHKNFKEYIAAKTNIARWQKKSDNIFYFANDKYSKWIAKKSRGKKISVSPSLKNLAWIKPLIKIPGPHNLENALMAATVAQHLKIPRRIIADEIRKFRGNEHRLEFVRTIKNGESRISFYNDSASTIPHTTIAAIKSFGDPTILIAGGRVKISDYTPLARALKKSRKAVVVVLFGEDKQKINRAIQKSGAKIVTAKNLAQSITTAYSLAKKIKRNSVVVFSPGATSFDMFNDYADRGRQFKKIVKRLK